MMKMFKSLAIGFSLAVLPRSAFAGPFDYQFEELAPNVWSGVRADEERFPVMGNTTFVIGEKGVIVFDGGGVPGMSDQIIDKVRSLTEVHITHVVISHWHGDHNFGVYRFAEEFPNVQYIAHRFTDAAMDSAKIDYILGYESFIETRVPRYKGFIDTGKDFDGSPINKQNKKTYEYIIAHQPEIDKEYKRAKITRPNLILDDKLTVDVGGIKVDLFFAGHGNTEGDIIMWIPDHKIVATGDIVVFPSPYAFNAPPRKWVATLKNLKAMKYEIMVPGHGDLQTDTKYVDLLIESVTSIADQRDAMLAKGMSPEEIEPKLDLSEFEQRFTGGDAFISDRYDGWFVKPLRAAAVKALTGEPMVKLEPRKTVETD